MNVVEELKAKLENAAADEIKDLTENENPIHRFLLLAEYPDFAPDSDWWWTKLSNRSDLPWSKLLAKQPQFEKYCYWESVSRLELMLLAYQAPEIFKRRFPHGRVHDLYAFLTPLEKSCLLSRLPEYAEFVDWNELAEEFSIGNWFSLLAYQPQFEIYFDWRKVEFKQNHYWDMLLKKQPQFVRYCNLRKLYPYQLRKLMKHQPQIFENENTSFTENVF